MNKLTRSLSVVMAAAMLVSLAACSGNNSSSSSTPSSSSATGGSSSAGASSSGASSEASSSEAAPQKEHLTITGYYPMHPSDIADEIPKEGWLLDREYEEKYNITWDWFLVPATNEEEVFNITMASSDIPDLVFQSNYQKLHKYQEAWWELDDFIKGKYANLEKYFYDDPTTFALSADPDGKVRTISMLSEQMIGDTLLVRGDLVDEWGIELKDNMTKEDMYEVLKTVKAKDPTVIPYMTRKQAEGLIRRLCEGWSGIPQYAFVDPADNQVKFGGADERMKDVVIWLNQLYAEGLVDQEFPTTDTAAWQEKVLGDGVFLTHDNAVSRINWAAAEWEKNGVTGKWYKAIAPLSPDGTTKGQTSYRYPRQRQCASIFVGASEEKVDRILEMFDYAFSEEGIELWNYGREGVSFTKDASGNYQLIEEYQTAVDNKTYPFDQILKGNIGYIKLESNQVYHPKYARREEIGKAAKLYEDGGYIRTDLIEMKAIRFEDSEQEIINRYETDLKTYADEQLQKFITGVTPIDQWDAYIAGYAGYHLDEYLTAYNAAAARAIALLG